MPWPWWMSQSTMRILRTEGTGVTTGRPPLQARSPAKLEGAGLGEGVGGPRLRPAQHAPAQPVRLLGVSGRNGHVVEHAEPIGGSPLAVVPGRPEGEGAGPSVTLCPHVGAARGGGGSQALTSPGRARSAPLQSARRPPAAARPPRPAGRCGRCSGGRGAGEPHRLPLTLCPHRCQAAGYRVLNGMGQDSPRCQLQGVGTSMNTGLGPGWQPRA